MWVSRPSPLLRAMIERAVAAKVPFSLVAADTVYGAGDIETMLRKAGKGYVLGVTGTHPFNSWGDRPTVAGTATRIAEPARVGWRRLSAGEGTKGPPLHDWAYLELADLDAADYNSTLTGEWTRGLLVRRGIADGDLAFFSTWCPKGTTMENLVTVEGHRWAIEDSFETAKNELGLDHNETRSWHGWHRHVSLVMLAFAMMAAIRRRANARRPKKFRPGARKGPNLIRWSIQELRRITTRLAQRRIQPACVIAWSFWRRAHQADARTTLTTTEKRNCNASITVALSSATSEFDGPP